MKPIYIRMKAFGSYRDERIDFDDVDHGIFLITGDTGAGKTTIFDAITYALFDSSSGGKRDEQMMISQYAKPMERTEVEYCFKIGEDRYKIVRIPGQKKYRERVSASGEVVYEENKTTTQAQVELTLPDGSIFTGKKKETDEKIKEIIGIDCQQFTQVAMLAQGEFIKLLHASSKARKEIFAKIFDTSLYALIEREIDSRCKKLNGELEDNKKLLIDRLGDVQVYKGSELELEWASRGVFSEDGKESILDAIRAINAELEEKGQEYEKEIKEIEGQLSDMAQKIKRAEQINTFFDKLEKAQREEKQLAEKQKEMTAKAEKLAKAKKALNVEGLERVYDAKKKDLDEKQNQVVALTTAVNETREALAGYEVAKRTAQEKYDREFDQKMKDKNTVEGKLSVFNEAELISGEYAKAKSALDKAEKELAKVVTSENKIADKESEASTLFEMYQEAKERHERKYTDFIHNQAVILRKTLVEGEPCPVCGSTHHVIVDESEGEQVSEKEVDEAKKAMDTAEKKYNAAKQELDSLKERISAEKHKAEAEKLEATILEAEKKKQLEEVNNKLPFKTRKEAEAEIDRLSVYTVKLKKDKENAETAYLGAKEKEGKLSASLETEKNNEETFKGDAQSAYLDFERSFKENGFSTKEEYDTAKMEAKKRDEIQNEIEEYHEAVRENKQNIGFYIESTKGETRIDDSEFKEKQKELGDKKKQAEDRSKGVFALLDGNKKAMKKIFDGYSEREGLRKQYVVVKSLNDTASGKLAKRHINFQTYIQRRYFKRVIDAANERLVKMSKNQFILQCRDLEKLGTQGEVGLDLDVYSLVNDQTRDVKSLSGGESFQAALSMALGLSDIIQNATGKIRVDTMFIDEGFGSLSDDTRNEALEMLNELSEGNQLIGIISHVSELKAQVETKLIVTKSESGSKAVWSR